MATTYLRGESASANPLEIFATFDRATLAKTVEVLVCVLDAMDGDPDVELNGDEEEPTGDEGDDAWIEWTSMRGPAKRGPNSYGPGNRFGPGNVEDVEDCDPAEEDDPSGNDADEDEPEGFIPPYAAVTIFGAGCPIADPGGCEHDGREPDHDAEVETWAHWLDHPPELHVGKRPGHTK